MSRLQLYVAGSAVLANVVLLRAYYERPNFYSAAVYISQSTGSLMFLINLGLIITASFCYGLQRLFYGSLRPIETEQLYDKAWFAVSETLLAMTIFRDDIGIWFFAMFLCLLAGKVWQWIGEGRVEFLEQQPPANPNMFHIRLASSLLLSVAFDVFMMQYCFDSILKEARPGVMVMFGFEYVLLAVASLSTLLRYTLTLVELLIVHRQEKAREEARRVAREQAQQRQRNTEGDAEPAAEEHEEDDEGEVPGWEEKGRWVFYLDLTTDFIKSVVYLGFFMILMTFYGIPIHIMRDLFMTLRSFFKRINDFLQYRTATRDMNARYPDATVEELERENTCIVCREEMRPWVQPGAEDAHPGRRVDQRQRAKKLPCGHILHFNCLRSWLERQQVCPTCRRPVLAEASQNNQQNNQAPAGQQNPQNQQNQQNQQLPAGLQGFFPNLENQQQRQGGQHGQQGQPGPAGAPAGQPNRPAGNMRVFNFGPIRIALGNLRLPQNQQANANNPNNNPVNNVNNDRFADLARQFVQNHLQNQGQGQNQNQAVPQIPTMNVPSTGIPGAVAQHPADIQSDILRIQQNIAESLRQLNVQHSQLEHIHSLLQELNRIQQSSGVAASTGQELPHIAPLNPPHAPYFPPQAYFSNGPVMRPGDASLPEGVVLPEGWTLRPLTLQTQHGQETVQTPVAAQPSGRSEPATEAGPSAPLPPAPVPAPAQSEADSQSSQPEGSSSSTPTARAESSSPRPAEPSSLASSWSFGNTSTNAASEGASSAVASEGESEGSNVTRRTVTVEDAEDSEQ